MARKAGFLLGFFLPQPKNPVGFLVGFFEVEVVKICRFWWDERFVGLKQGASFLRHTHF